MRLLLLSDAGSVHTKKWVSSLSKKNITICLFSLNLSDKEFYEPLPNVIVHYSKIKSNSKSDYGKNIGHLKEIYDSFTPDIVHAHYATSYGLLGRKLNHPHFIISVWGTDVYKFPRKSLLHKWILKKNLSRANLVLSTSNCMAQETAKYTNKEIITIPFGVDLAVFKPRSTKVKDVLTIGTIKSLSKNYGIEYLIRAFAQVTDELPKYSMRLVIGGSGDQENELKDLVSSLKLNEKVKFLGHIDHSKVPATLQEFDLFVALSDSESFGVAVVEANACEVPAVVSDAEGLKEVVDQDQTGLIVPKRDAHATAQAIKTLLTDEELRIRLGKNARKKVEQLYDWEKNVAEMIDVYQQLIS